MFVQAPQSQEAALLDLLGGSPPTSSAAPATLPAGPQMSGGGALLDLLDLNAQQPAPSQPSAAGVGNLGVGLLDLLSAPAPPLSGQPKCLCLHAW